MTPFISSNCNLCLMEQCVLKNSTLFKQTHRHLHHLRSAKLCTMTVGILKSKIIDSSLIKPYDNPIYVSTIHCSMLSHRMISFGVTFVVCVDFRSFYHLMLINVPAKHV
ncbi:hypothetical protein ALC56_08536 [Trachymyrmex septentrionalis]|uniref:Uncharacterized protein n=1 Tax=Trachymyrmex septentrionalis TaxID=34720 RepID=A0A195F803_9HYME|nr:hypothetical protein ALC56_08536 [Trachymyrmex septentrionalis]